MKKKILILLGIALFSIYVFPADIRVKCSSWFSPIYNGQENHTKHNHKYFEACYLQETLNPEYVIWTLTKEEAIGAEENKGRTNDFRACINTAKLSDYKYSGFDRGHLCPSNDRDFSSESASATFLLCNMCPQTHSLNAGPWLKLENLGHDYAKKYGSIDIIAGPIYEGGRPRVTIGKNEVRVPDMFFKVFYNKKSNFIECYILYQSDTEVPLPVSIDVIEKLTGLKFIF